MFQSFSTKKTKIETVTQSAKACKKIPLRLIKFSFISWVMMSMDVMAILGLTAFAMNWEYGADTEYVL